jgi:hypothetical protein
LHPQATRRINITHRLDTSGDNNTHAALLEKEDLDDNEYTPRFIDKLLHNRDLLPHAFRDDFAIVFEDSIATSAVPRPRSNSCWSTRPRSSSWVRHNSIAWKVPS